MGRRRFGFPEMESCFSSTWTNGRHPHLIHSPTCVRRPHVSLGKNMIFSERFNRFVGIVGCLCHLTSAHRFWSTQRLSDDFLFLSAGNATGLCCSLKVSNKRWRYDLWVEVSTSSRGKGGFLGPVSPTLVSQHTLIAALCRYGRRFNVTPRVLLLSLLELQCKQTTSHYDMQTVKMKS